MNKNSRFVMIRGLLVLTSLLLFFHSSLSQPLNSWLQIETHPDSGMFGGYVRVLASGLQSPHPIYAGTLGGGIFRSDNAASRWIEMNDGLGCNDILSIAVDPGDDNVVFAGTEDGIFKSTDGGNYWLKKDLSNCQVNAIAIDPNDDAIIYVALGNRIGHGATAEKGIWRSDNGGDSWYKPDTLKHKGIEVEVYTVLVNKKSGEKSILVGTSNGIWQSSDGREWLDTTHVNNLWTDPVFALAINPNATNEIYAGTNADVYFSRDDGRTFVSTNRLYIDDQITCFAADDQQLFIGTSSRGLLLKDVSVNKTSYAATGLKDIQIYSILLDSTDHNIVYCATPNGVYKSEDRAVTFKKVLTGMTGLQVNQHLINPVNSDMLYTATSFGGFYSNDGGYRWNDMKTLPRGNVQLLAVNMVSGNELFAGVEKDWIHYSSDWGVNWTKLQPPQGMENYSIYSVIMDTSKAFLFVGSEDGIYRGSYPYHDLTSKLTTASAVLTIELKPVHPDTVFAGTKQGRIYRGTDSGETWEDVTNGVPPFREIYDIRCSPFDKKIVWGGTEKGLYRSKNAGTTWYRLDADLLTGRHVKQVLLDPLRPGIMYVLVENDGVYQSVDDGVHWRRLSENFSLYQDIVSYVSLHPGTSNLLFASTLGKGLFKFRAEPVLTFEKNPLIFDAVNVGKSQTLVNQMYNSGALPLLVDEISSSNDDISYTINSSAVDPNATTNLAVTFAPGVRGELNDSLFIRSNAVSNDTFLVLKGQAIAPILSMGASCDSFGYVATNNTKVCSFQVENMGDADFKFNVGFKNYGNIYKIEPATGTIYKNSAMTFEISFTPVDSVFYADTLHFSSDDAEAVFYGDSLKVLSGRGILGPGIKLSEKNHDFRVLKPGATKTWTFQVKNIGSDTLRIADIRCDDCAVFTVDTTEATLPADSILDVNVIFTSAVAGEFPGCALRIHSNATFGDNVVTLSGRCLANVPIIELSPEVIDFKLVQIGEVGSDTILIKNTGEISLEISDIQWQDASLILQDTSFVVNVDDSCFLNIEYHPQRLVPLNDTLKFVTNNAVGCTTVVINGTSIAPKIEMPDTLDFGLVLINSEVHKNLEIGNAGLAAFNGTPVIDGKDKGYFTANDSEISVPVQGKVSSKISFHPEMTGEHWAALKLESSTHFEGDSIIILTGFCYDGPKLKAEPADSMVFRTVRVGEKICTRIRITNDGSDTLKINQFSTGSNFFEISMDTTNLMAREHASMTVCFVPNDNIKFTDTLRIASNTFGDSITIIPLIGYGVAPEIEVTPENMVDFERVNPGTTKRDTIIIKNSGNADLTVTEISLAQTDSYYSLVTFDENYSPLSPNGSTEFYVKFSANSDTVYPYPLLNCINIKSDAMNNSNYSLELKAVIADLEKPIIIHTPLPVAEKGEPVIIMAEVTDSLSGINNVWLEYRQGGSSRFNTPVRMQADDLDKYSYPILEDSVTTRGVDYKITAEDWSGNDVTVPAIFYSIPVHVSGDGETRVDGAGNSMAQPAGTESNAYRLISIPLTMEKPYPKDVLEDDLGIFDAKDQRKMWRLAECKYPQYAPPDCYVFYNESEDDSVSDFTPGKAFFLIVRDEGKIIDSGPGTSLPTNVPFGIRLNRGWNLVGNPFNFAVPTDQLKLRYNDAGVHKEDKDFLLLSFEEKWLPLSNDGSDYIKPWQGYALHTFRDADTLFVYANKMLLDEGSQAKSLEKSNSDLLWKIQIFADCNQVRDDLNIVGVSSLAKDGYDTFDQPEPLVIGNFVAVYIPHSDWGEYSNRFTIDIQNEGETGNCWDFEVAANMPGSEVKLWFNKTGDIPGNFGIQLIDRLLKVAKNIDDVSSYSFITETGEVTKRRFRLIVGTGEYLDARNLGIVDMPKNYYLSQNYPNPFNPTTSIYYQLPEMNRVTIKIVNILGQVVQVLVDDEVKMAGTHTLIWDGTDHQHRNPASGLYLCYMNCGRFKSVRKLILLK